MNFGTSQKNRRISRDSPVRFFISELNPMWMPEFGITLIREAAHIGARCP